MRYKIAHIQVMGCQHAERDSYECTLMCHKLKITFSQCPQVVAHAKFHLWHELQQPLLLNRIPPFLPRLIWRGRQLHAHSHRTSAPRSYFVSSPQLHVPSPPPPKRSPCHYSPAPPTYSPHKLRQPIPKGTKTPAPRLQSQDPSQK